MAKDPKELLLRDPHVRHALLDILRNYAESKSPFAEVVSRTLRMRKNLSSVRRRTVSDMAFNLIRFDRSIRFLLELGCTQSNIDAAKLDPEQQLITQYLLGLMVCEKISSDEITQLEYPALVLDIIKNVANPKRILSEQSSPLSGLALTHSVPDWMVEKLTEQRGFEDTEQLLQSINQRAPLWLRANSLKTDVTTLSESLITDGCLLERGLFSPWAINLKSRANIRGLRAFREGHIEAQDEGSQLIAEITGAAPGGRVIDYCAGAGGKTLAMGAMMKGQGSILACDININRLKKMTERLERAGLKTVEFHDLNTPLPKPWSQGAEVVLVDAPCTGSGSLRRQPERKNNLREDEIAIFQETQIKVLTQASELVRPGGRLIYATCSLFNEENEDIAHRFETENSDFTCTPLVEVLDMERAKAIGDGQFLRMFPHLHNSDGFFAAVFTRR